MLLDNSNQTFSFFLPKSFIPKEVNDKYQPYIDKKAQNIYRNVIDYINFSVQGINLPGASYSPVEQQPNNGTRNLYRSSDPTQNTIEREFTVTFKLTDGFFNYWVLRDSFLYHYARSTREPFLDNFTLNIHDLDGINVALITFIKPLMTNITDIEFNFSSNIADFQTFDINFSYNRLDVSVLDN